MAITSSTQTRSGTTTTVTVVSSLSGTVYFHWYLDGTYLGVTLDPSRSFVLLRDDQARVTVLDTTDPAFDPISNAPAGYPARRTLVFSRTLDASVVRYRIEQQRAGGSWTVLGYIGDDPARWIYEFLTGRLDDLTLYAWRVIPMDAAGNDGTAITISAETIVRTPDAPDFAAAFSSGTTRVTFAGVP